MPHNYYLNVNKMTEQLKAYAMYDMGDGFYWNEIAFRDNILANADENYKVHPVRIQYSSYDYKRGELKLAIEKEDSGSQYPLRLVNSTSITSFLRDIGARKTNELIGKRAIGLFSNNILEWLIVYSGEVTQDNINQTRIDARDLSHLNIQNDDRLDDLIG